MLLRTAFQAFVTALHEHLAGSEFADIGPAHGNVFQFIDRDGTRLTELARRAQLTKQAMQELVDYLERHGYVERVPDPHDARAKLVRLTKRGWEVIPVGHAAINEIEPSAKAALGARRYRQLRELLLDLGDAWDKNRPKPRS